MPQPSAFLPPGYDPSKPVALIAGQGLYPVLVAQAIRRAGLPLKLIAFDEETVTRTVTEKRLTFYPVAASVIDSVVTESESE